MGLVQAENIQVHAEAYDVALDMSFPKGPSVFDDVYWIQTRLRDRIWVQLWIVRGLDLPMMLVSTLRRSSFSLKDSSLKIRHFDRCVNKCTFLER